MWGGGGWRRVLSESESERAGVWSDEPELPLPELECACEWTEPDLPECWLPRSVSDEADAAGEFFHGGYVCSRCAPGWCGCP